MLVLTYPIEGDISGMWSLLPAVIGGWMLGMRAALVLALLTLPATYAVFHLENSPVANLLAFHVVGAIGTAAVGIATGWVKGLLDRSSQQARQLERERETLRGEVAKRKQAEEALQETKDDLEHAVQEQTAQLKHTNDRLSIELVERKRAEEETSLKIKELATLNQIGRALNKLVSPSEILGLIKEMIGRIFDNRNLYIALYDPVSQEISFPIYTIDGENQSIAGRPFDNGLTEFVIRTNAPLLIPEHMPAALEARGIAQIGRAARCYLGVPLAVNGKAMGVIAVQDYEQEHVYNTGHTELLSTIASQAAIALENAHLYASVQQELAERQRAEEQLTYSAFHDPLTGLPNRALFMDRLGRTLERAKRHEEYLFAVLFLDMDRFKIVNDSLGHATGDQLLLEVARRLQKCLRTIDTVARLGGDEFVLLLEDIEDLQGATRVADRIQRELESRFDLEGNSIFTTASIGIVQGSTNYAQAEDMLRDADIAMYRAKMLGKARYEVFDATMRDRAVARLELETGLRSAIAREEFQVYYQPILSLKNNRITGFEALVRWQHPQRGLVAPAEFIPMAEDTGLIIPIGQWVLREACRQIRKWQAQFPADPPLTISVNLSPKQFAQLDLISQIERTLAETGLDAHSLKLEITESIIVEDAEGVNQMLAQLRARGVEVQIDDFGTGYSSLGQLHRLPIDTLKIDRTFISRIGHNGNGSEIVQTILTLAHDLGMKVVAEGVETTNQLAKLKHLECEFGQGFLFAKPLDGLAATDLLTESFTADRYA